MDLSGKIDCVTHLTEEEFRKNYLQAQKPVVIRGLANNTEAGKTWSIDHFRSKMGEINVGVLDNKNKKAASSAFTHADIHMKLKDYLDIISKDEHTDLRIFLFNLFRYEPRLRKEFPCPAIFRGLLSRLGYMFFGGKDTTVRIHYDIDMSHVLHTHFGGRKRVVLFSPEYTKLLYCLPLNTYSPIDPDKPDLSNYPALQYVKGAEVILEAGDSIFMPAGYWHYMTYLEGSFSVSYRKLPGLKKMAQGFLNLVIYMPLDKFLNKAFGKSWFDLKMRIAQKRASQALTKANGPHFKDILGV